MDVDVVGRGLRVGLEEVGVDGWEVGEVGDGVWVLLILGGGEVVGGMDVVGEVVCGGVVGKEVEEVIVAVCDVLKGFSSPCSSPPPSTTSTRTLIPSMGTPE